jgi:hypothetical protein
MVDSLKYLRESRFPRLTEISFPARKLKRKHYVQALHEIHLRDPYRFGALPSMSPAQSTFKLWDPASNPNFPLFPPDST